MPDSLISPGVIVSGSQVQRLGALAGSTRRTTVRGSRAASSPTVRSSGPAPVVRRAILDKNVVIGPGVRVGYSAEEDRERGLTISEGGVVVGGKGMRIL